MQRFKEDDLKRIEQGDSEPLKLVFLAHFSDCCEKLMRYCSCSEADAEDLVMESFIVLREKVIRREFKNDNLPAFIIAVAKNKWRNKFKRDQKLVSIDTKLIQSIEHYTLESEAEEEQEYRVKLVLTAIEKLPEKCKELLTENLLNGLSLKVLVEKLDYSSYDVLKTSKSRCMKKLRELINESKAL